MKKAVFQPLAVLAAAGLCAAVVGCSGGGSSASTTTPAASDPDKSKPDDSKKYHIDWTAYQLAPTDKDAPMVKYWNEKFNVDLNVWNIEARNYEEVISLKLASGEVPDVIRVESHASFKKYADQNILAAIPEDMIKTYAPNLYKEYIDADPDHQFNYGKVNGKIYGFNSLNIRGRYRDPIVVRGDWLKKVGITKPPETLQEFETMIYKFANEDPDGNGKKDTYGLSDSGLFPVYGAFGYVPVTTVDRSAQRDNWQVRDGKLVNAAVQPEMKDALKMISKWYKDGVLDPEFVTGENKGGAVNLTQSFASGRIGVTTQGAFIQWNPSFPGRGTEGKNRAELRKLNAPAADALVLLQPPKGTSGKGVMTQQQTVLGSYVAFGKQLEKEPDKMAKILQMIDYMCFSTYEHYADGLYGVGNWEVDAKTGLVTALGKFKDAAEAAKIGAHSVSNVLNSLKFKEKDFEPYQDWLKETKLTENGSANKLETALPSESKYNAELSKLRDETYISIITGDKPIDYFDEFVQKWRKAGGDTLEKEANDWYQANKKKK
ncbi:extracellular solute-binding protein [Paenibacillus sp. CC-CFT747]|nr:extracellular solute-binding protein [Paenibacillus sp. CC-CFT747]